MNFWSEYFKSRYNIFPISVRTLIDLNLGPFDLFDLEKGGCQTKYLVQVVDFIWFGWINLDQMQIFTTAYYNEII